MVVNNHVVTIIMFMYFIIIDEVCMNKCGGRRSTTLRFVIYCQRVAFPPRAARDIFDLDCKGNRIFIIN